MTLPIDQVINNKWFELYESYTKENNLSIETTIQPPSLQQQSQDQSQMINIGTDIPLLQELINSQSNPQQLTKELKNLLLKFYWSGFDLGYDSNKPSKSN